MPNNLFIFSFKMPAVKLHHRFTLGQVLGILLIILCVVEIHDQAREYFKQRRRPAATERAENIFQPRNLSGTFETNGIEYFAEKKPGTYRILIYGGSAAASFGMDYQKSWWYLMQESLKENNNLSIEVINFARGAFTSIDDYVNFMREGRQLQPDLVIVYNGWNDIAAFLGNPGWITKMTGSRLSEIGKNSSEYAKKTVRSPVSLVRRYYKLKEKLEKNISLFYARLESFRTSVFNKIRLLNLFPEDTLSKYLAASAPPSFEEIMAEDSVSADYIPIYPLYSEKIKKIYSAYYEKNLDSLARALKEREIPGVFVFQPDLLFTGSRRALSKEEEEIGGRLLGNNSGKWREAVKEFYPEGMDIMRRTAGKYGFTFLNMQKAVKNYPGTEIFQDNVHYTAQGNQIIAREMLKKIRLNEIQTAG